VFVLVFRPRPSISFQLVASFCSDSSGFASQSSLFPMPRPSRQTLLALPRAYMPAWVGVLVWGEEVPAPSLERLRAAAVGPRGGCSPSCCAASRAGDRPSRGDQRKARRARGPKSSFHEPVSFPSYR